MFYFLNGIVAHKEPNLAVIDCGGVGYACFTTLVTSSSLEAGKQAKLYTYLHVREDIFDLFGFAKVEELDCFKMLIGISGVGPKAALSILSGATPERFALAVMTGDEKILTNAPGIGKKLAQRIILELKDKVAKQNGGAVFTGAAAADLPSAGGVAGDALSALMVLGYSSAEATGALRMVETDGLSAEETIRAALKNLVKVK